MYGDPNIEQPGNLDFAKLVESGANILEELTKRDIEVEQFHLFAKANSAYSILEKAIHILAKLIHGVSIPNYYWKLKSEDISQKQALARLLATSFGAYLAAIRLIRVGYHLEALQVIRICKECETAMLVIEAKPDLSMNVLGDTWDRESKEFKKNKRLVKKMSVGYKELIEKIEKQWGDISARCHLTGKVTPYRVKGKSDIGSTLILSGQASSENFEKGCKIFATYIKNTIFVALRNFETVASDWKEEYDNLHRSLR